MKSNILTINGEKKGQISLPECFREEIRIDLITKIIEAKKVWQPYAPSPVAGNQYSASGKLKHHRKVWKSQYGRGMSRVPRKTMTRKGSQFNWVGATVPNTRGGRRAHPPKILSMISFLKINKKELKLALKSALSATVSGKWIIQRYDKLKEKKIESLPIIVESKICELKTKELLNSLKNILGQDLFEVAIKKRSVRKGKGKLRGRRYKKNLGALIVIGEKEKMKTNTVDVVSVKKLSIKDLADGGVGRLTVYTESAIKELGEKLK